MMTRAALRPLAAATRTGRSARRAVPHWPLRSVERSRAPSSSRASPVARTAAQAGRGGPARYLLQIAAAALTAVTVREMSALVGDPMVAAMLTLILALPFALALFHSPTKDRRRS